MTSTTISLEKSAYELLKSRKRPDESFSEEVVRLLGQNAPNLRDFLNVVSESDGETVARSIESVRKEDLMTAERNNRSRKHHGRRA